MGSCSCWTKGIDLHDHYYILQNPRDHHVSVSVAADHRSCHSKGQREPQFERRVKSCAVATRQDGWAHRLYQLVSAWKLQSLEHYSHLHLHYPWTPSFTWDRINWCCLHAQSWCSSSCHGDFPYGDYPMPNGKVKTHRISICKGIWGNERMREERSKCLIWKD